MARKKWRVDFVLKKGNKLVAIEVKSSAKKEALSGLASFQKMFKPYRLLLVGEQGVKLEDFLKTPIDSLFNP